MRTSLSMRAAAASAAVALSLSPGLEAAFAHGQASLSALAPRSGFVHNRGFPPGWRNGDRQSWNWRGGYRGNRYGGNGWFWNQGGFYGGGFDGPGFWYSPYAYGSPGLGPAGGGGLIIAVGGPSASNFPAAAADSPDPNVEGGCVIHKLIYDSSGKYVGERQTFGC